MRLRLAVLFVIVTAVAVPATASASEIIDRNANDVSLKVAQNGQALVSYSARGKRWNVLAWGALNALHPTPAGKQVEFKLDYSGGYGTYKKRRLEDVQERLPRVRRPRAAVVRRRLQGVPTAPTGRSSPGSGCCRTTASRRRPKQSVWELRLSHFRGELPVLTVNLNWAYSKFHHIFGSFTYLGRPCTASSRRPPASRWTRSAATSTSTRSTRPTARAGCARTAS